MGLRQLCCVGAGRYLPRLPRENRIEEPSCYENRDEILPYATSNRCIAIGRAAGRVRGVLPLVTDAGFAVGACYGRKFPRAGLEKRKTSHCRFLRGMVRPVQAI